MTPKQDADLQQTGRAATKPPRVLLPFWVQLFGSYILVLLLVAGSIMFFWEEIETIVVAEPRAFVTASSAEMAAAYMPADFLYDTPADRRSRENSTAMAELAATHSGSKNAGSSLRRIVLGLPRGDQTTITSTMAPDFGDGELQSFSLRFSIAVPTPQGWRYWLSSDPAYVDKPVGYGNYIDSYVSESRGWDNFRSADGKLLAYKDSNHARIAARLKERELPVNPPRDGVNVGHDAFVSVRPIGRRLDHSLLPQDTLGADLSRAVLIAELPREAMGQASFMLKFVFLGLTTVATILALLVAVFVTWRMTRPISSLYSAMLAISAGYHDYRIRSLPRLDEFGRLAWQFNAMMDEFQGSRALTAGVALAAQIQRQLVPEPPTDIAGLDLAAWYAPSSQVGGDYYDFIRKGSKLYVAAGDAVGHGVDSGLIMAGARSMVRTSLEFVDSPGAVLTLINRQLAKDFTDGNFLTLLIACYDLETGAVTISSAGHEPAILVSGHLGKACHLRANGPPLGVWCNHRYGDCEPVALGGGDAMIFSSDGIRECHNAQNELFGKERFLDAASGRTESAEALLQRIRAAVTAHAGGRPFEDDISIVILRGTGTARRGLGGSASLAG